MGKTGRVYLVGAGPGDPELITLKGHRLLQRADVVVVDALVSTELLKGLKAKIIFAGKRGPGAEHGASHELKQEKINQLLIQLALKGNSVVRLKGGDPFLFGRGMEEVEALQAKSIPVQVIPGLSSATAVPVCAGISITDRRLASQVTILTGHEGKNKSTTSSSVDWSSLSPKGTLVIMMGVSQWSEIQKRLLKLGWSAQTPVAAIESGTRPDQRIIESTLINADENFKARHLVSPAIVVVGKVAGVRNKESLYGRRVVVLRPESQSNDLIKLLESAGADVLVSPSIKIIPVRKSPAISWLNKQLKLKSGRYDWILFLSVNAAKSLCEALGSNRSYLKSIPKLAIGPQTRNAVIQAGWASVGLPKEYHSLGVLKTLGNIEGKRILLPRVKNAPPLVSNLLRKRGAVVDEIVTYRTVGLRVKSKIKNEILKGVGDVVFTSSSTANNFLSSFNALEKKRIFDQARAISVGPQTTATLKELGVLNIVEAKNATKEMILEAIHSA